MVTKANLLKHVGCSNDRFLTCKICATIRAIVRRYLEQNDDLEEICENV